MDMTTMPGWAQTALAITTVVIVALTMLANFLDWAVPRLRALGPKGEEERALTAVEKFAKALTAVLSFVHRLVPRLTTVEPDATVMTASTTLIPVASASTESKPTADASIEASQAAARETSTDGISPHGPFAD